MASPTSSEPATGGSGDFRQVIEQALAGMSPADLQHHSQESEASNEDQQLMPLFQVREHQYQVINGWLCLDQSTKKEIVYKKLANFTARIVLEVVIDDGTVSRKEFEIEATCEGVTRRFTVPAEQFEKMEWVLPNLGSRAVVTAGYGIKDHLRAAIQLMSGDVLVLVAFSHIGWRKIEGKWLYLHKNGAIGADGTDIRVVGFQDRSTPNSLQGEDISQIGPVGPILKDKLTSFTYQVRLQDEVLSEFALPPPPSGQELREAVKDAFLFLQLGPDHITLPIFAQVFRAVLGPSDFSIQLVGKTGTGKSSIAALAQQFFGQGIGKKKLLGHGAATANYLNHLQFLVKDALCVLDDLIPLASGSDVERAFRDADRVYRAQGNLSFRGRCNPNGTAREAKRPRGSLITTAEVVPPGSSANARCLIIDVKEEDLLKKKEPPLFEVREGEWVPLYRYLKDLADQGVFAKAMSGYLAWLAPKYEKIVAEYKDQVMGLEPIFQEDDKGKPLNLHPRAPSIAAELLAGLEPFLDFAVEIGVIDKAEFDSVELDSIWHRFHEAIRFDLKAQAVHQFSPSTVQQFLELLRGILLSGRAHIQAYDGSHPGEGALAWGWQGQPCFLPKEKVVPKVGEVPDPPKEEKKWGPSEEEEAEDRRFEYEERLRLIPKGKCIGWLFQGRLYLEPAATLAEVRKFAKECDINFLLTNKTLGKALFEARLLVEVDPRGDRYTVRETIKGRRSNFYQLAPTTVFALPWYDPEHVVNWKKVRLEEILEAKAT